MDAVTAGCRGSIPFQVCVPLNIVISDLIMTQDDAVPSNKEFITEFPDGR
jgi:hypothetical protein